MESYEWIEASPGKYQRDLNVIDKLFSGLVDRSKPREERCIYAQVTVKYTGEDIIDTARNAWKATRVLFPGLSTTISNGKKHYECLKGEEEIEQWLQQTFIVTNEEPRTVIRNAAWRDLATLFYCQDASTFLLQSSHWRIDARGALLFFDGFLQAMENPKPVEFGQEYKNLPAALETAISIASASPPEAIEEVNRLFSSVGQAMPSMKLEMTPNRQCEGSDFIRIIFSTEETGKILKGAKTRGYTITRVAQAALCLATKEMANPELHTGKMTPSSIFSMREWCGEYKDAVECYICGMPIVVEPTTFEDTVQQVDAAWKKWARTDLFKKALPYFIQMILPILTAPQPSTPSEPFLSAFGIADDYLRTDFGKIQVTDFSLQDERTTGNILLSLWTFQGKLNLNLAYNYGYYEKDEAGGFLERVKSIILKELIQEE